ncbi:EAL domain-containing protein [Klebsiella aerogenes]|nr:EAL domain-containing protein [Klebsiella aerogenes]ELA2606834.1 EAL domain-containing protein [Klebsiella aerogenes]EMC9823476.1 EAL domain-containing protein [Klebsiella aerogenes]HEO1675009.1 EAL domain-containing protein [Klebsiella aerogenes]
MAPWHQPIMDVTTGQVRGVEVLARWHHPRKGVLPPDIFIPLAECSGLIR